MWLKTSQHASPDINRSKYAHVDIICLLHEATFWITIADLNPLLELKGLCDPLTFSSVLHGKNLGLEHIEGIGSL